VQELDARYALPTRQAMSSRMIPQRYCEVKSDLRVRISHSKVRAVTTDMWTSSNNQAYMGVTAHWLDASFSMQSKCLAVKPAPGSHTAEFISAELTEVLADCTIDPNQLTVVTDSGANVKKAITQMPLVKWRPCFAHTLQLVVNGGLAARDVSELPKLLAKARAIVGHFRRSPLATSQLEMKQKQLNLPSHKLLQDCPTRWNSQVKLLINSSPSMRRPV